MATQKLKKPKVGAYRVKYRYADKPEVHASLAKVKSAVLAHIDRQKKWATKYSNASLEHLMSLGDAVSALTDDDLPVTLEGVADVHTNTTINVTIWKES